MSHSLLRKLQQELVRKYFYDEAEAVLIMKTEVNIISALELAVTLSLKNAHSPHNMLTHVVKGARYWNYRHPH